MIALKGLTSRLPAPGDGSRSAWLEFAATLLIVSLGLVLRQGGVVFGPSIGFWVDEASWATRVMEMPLKDLLIRPIGFMLLTRWSVLLFGHWEFAFRLLPWLAGLATPFIAVLLGRRFLHRPAARLSFVGVLSLSPVAIDYAKEFKPYGISLMLHLLLALLVLRWHETRRMRDLLLAGSAAALGSFFAQDVIFLYPGLFLVLGFESWRKRDFRQLAAAAAVATLSAGIILGMYALIWSRLPKDQDEYWGDKYGVFHRPKDPSDTAVDWYAGKYAEIAQMPSRGASELLPPSLMHEARSLEELGWLVLHVLGLTVMLRQRRGREALLFLSPTLICALFNVLGHWPFGPFRTNLFMLAGMSAIAALGLDRRGQPRRAWTSLVPVGLLVVLPFATSDHDWGRRKAGVHSSYMPQMLDQLLALEETRGIKDEPLFLDRHSVVVLRYYLNHYERASDWREPFEQKFEWKSYTRKQMLQAARRLRPNQRAWIMLRGDDPPPAVLRPRLVLAPGEHVLYAIERPKRR